MGPRSRYRAALLLLAATVPTGCCNLALWWCGPDRSRWVSVSYIDPDAALATFLEAVRRDRPGEICTSLTRAFRARQGLPGCFEAAIAWEKLKQQFQALHLLGSAEVSQRDELADGRVRFALEVAGYDVTVVVRRIAVVLVRYRIDGRVEDAGYRQDSLYGLVTIERVDDIDQNVLARLTSLDLPPDLPPEDLVTVSAGYEWRVDELSLPGAAAGGSRAEGE
ncbi:MAG: hypothetical protein AAF628_00365 [Planctomycetota bacterium]